MSRLLCPLLILLLPTLPACERSAPPLPELTGSAMGTTYSIKLVSLPGPLSEEELGKAVASRLEQIEDLASTYRANSELSRFNANPSTDWVAASPELCELIDGALKISELTDGAFDVTVGPLVNLWGFGPEGAVFEPPAEAEISAALEKVGYRGLQTRCSVPAIRKTHPGMYVDLSAWAKGHAVDEIADLLEGRGLVDYLVEIGGEMRAGGRKAGASPWRVAVERPAGGPARQVAAVFELTDSGVATSGDYRNFFEYEKTRYSHTIDPRTGWPVTHQTASVTVIDPSAAVADAMATAMLVLGVAEGTALARSLGTAAYFQYRVDGSFKAVKTPALQGLASS